MSSGVQAPTVAEKLDLRKYLLIFRRRKWWGIVPFVLLALVFTVLCFAVPPKYLSTCVIKASKSEVAEIYGTGGATRKARTSLAIVKEGMLRYGRVIGALADTDIMRDIARQSEGRPTLGARLQEELFQRIVKHTYIDSMGALMIRVAYFGETPGHAHTVLDKLTKHFIENALGKERANARVAMKMAADELTAATTALEGVEGKLETFGEEHPGVSVRGEGSIRAMRVKTANELEKLDQNISAYQSRLDRYREQLETMPEREIKKKIDTTANPEVTVFRTKLAQLKTRLTMSLKTYTPRHPLIKNLRNEITATEEQLARVEREAEEVEIELKENELRSQIEAKKLELEADLDSKMEFRRKLQLKNTRLEEQVQTLPGLLKELGRLERQKEAAEDGHGTALKRFQRINEEYHTTMEGLVSFSIIDAARTPQTKDIRHILRLALMGLFVAVAAGVGAIAGSEFLDQSFTDVESARAFLRLPSLGVIPLIETRSDKKGRLVRYALVASAGLIVIAAIVLAVLYVDPVAKLAEDLWLEIRDLCKNVV